MQPLSPAGTGAAAPAARRLLLVTTVWWPSVAVLAMALRAAGFEIVLLCPAGHPACAAPGVRCIALPARSSGRAIAAAIDALRPTLVVPMDDRAVTMLHALHDGAGAALRAVLERSLGPPASFAVTRSRSALCAAASAVGIATPEEVAVSGTASIDAHFARSPQPLALKLDGVSGGQGVAIVAGARAGRRAYRRLRLTRSLPYAIRFWLVNGDPFWMRDWRLRRRSPITAQHLVPGRSGDVALFCRDGEVLGMTVAIAEARSGDRGPFTFIRTIRCPDLEARLRALVARLGLTGFYGFDVLFGESGAVTLIEMNPRMTPLCAIEPQAAGAPIAAAAAAIGAMAGGGQRRPGDRAIYAHFPSAWRAHPGDGRLLLCAADIPDLPPAMMTEMLAPAWSDRGHLARFRSKRRFAGMALSSLSSPPASRVLRRDRRVIAGG